MSAFDEAFSKKGGLMNEKKLRNITLSFLFLCISCGISKKDSVKNVEIPVEVPVEKPVILQAGVSLQPPKHILYLNNEIKNKFTQIPMVKETMSFISSLGGKLYSATGDGGLGVALDMNNRLIDYDGIPVETTGVGSKGESPTIFVSGSGDKNCDEMFHKNSYDPHTKKILIDYSKVNALTICKVSVRASLGLDGKVTEDEKDFEIVLNPTMLTYSSMKEPETGRPDPMYRYLAYARDKNGVNDPDEIAQWIQSFTKNNKELRLRYTPTSFNPDNKIPNANALTGAQSITKLDLSKTGIMKLDAIVQLQNLQELNLSGCDKLLNSEIPKLGRLKSLKSLNLSNINLTDARLISDNIKSLEVLDISYNKNIDELETIENLPNLKKLNVSGTGLSSLEKLRNLRRLTDLDISNNDFSVLSEKDASILSNLYDLEYLNVSNSHFSNEFLNKYFEKASSMLRLKKFIDANNFNYGVFVTKEDCNKNTNNFKLIPYFSDMISLQYIDISGNWCIIDDGYHIGLHDASPFVKMKHLEYLDISNNPIESISLLVKNNENLKELHIAKHRFYNPDKNELTEIDQYGNPSDRDRYGNNFEQNAGGNIIMTTSECNVQLEYKNQLTKECQFLEEKTKVIEFKESHKSFNIPWNVRSVNIEMCSAGNGGSGSSGTTGSDSSETRSVREGPPCRGESCNPPTYRDIKNIIHSNPATSGEPGGIGQTVKIINVETGEFVESTQELSNNFPISELDFCRGGAMGGTGNRLHKKLVKITINTEKYKVFDIEIPQGGKGGAAGIGSKYISIIPKGPNACDGSYSTVMKCNGSNGIDGEKGSDGSNGYLKISYSIPK